GGEALCIGAGGSALAMVCHLLRCAPTDRPSRIVMSNRNGSRWREIRRVHRALGASVPLELHIAGKPEDNDRLMGQLKPHSLVVNATGLGKDTPGSPITDAARFPKYGFAWDFNYRGELVFLEQARAQAGERRLRIEDGWSYFLHGWTAVIAEVFGLE